MTKTKKRKTTTSTPKKRAPPTLKVVGHKDNEQIEHTRDDVVAEPNLQDFMDYQIDLWQRTILFLDTLRQRGNNMLEHERAGLPPLLDFKYETILDARHFETPVNYALLRITEVGDDCWEDCVDPN